MARFLILSINYSPEATGFAPHTTALAEFLVRTGHQVNVVTGFPFAPKWRRWPEYRAGFTQRESMNGVVVTRITHFIPRHPRRIAGRLLMEGSFALVAGVIAGIRSQSIDAPFSMLAHSPLLPGRLDSSRP